MKALFTALAIVLSLSIFAVEKSPFTDVIYKQTPGAPAGVPTISVTLEGNDYYLLAVSDVEMKDIMIACVAAFADDCEEKFALNFVEVMLTVGVQVEDMIKLKLYQFSQHRVVTLEDALVLEENIDEILFNRELRGE
jgi:hypothetical protein